MGTEVEKDRKFGVSACDEYFDTLPVVQMPAQIGDKILTLNKQGFMRVELDPFTLEWVKDSALSNIPFLELGAAYGEASIRAIRNGGNVIANDISIEHLTILRNRLEVEYHNRLYLNHAEFPSQTNFPANSLGGVLFCRLGHFFTNEQMRKGLRKIYDWLAPGGNLYFVSISLSSANYNYLMPTTIITDFVA